MQSEFTLAANGMAPACANATWQRIGPRADVIVMGTHGRRGLNRLLLGSDAERVLRDALVPVLLTRHPGRKAARKKAGKSSTAPRRPASSGG